MSIVLIVNNKSNRLSRRLPGILTFFEERFPGRVKFLFTTGKWHAAELARRETETGCGHLIAVGGDGTLHEVINGLLQSDVPSNALPAIGLLPWGSANDFARTAGIANTPEDLSYWIRNGITRRIDVGEIRLEASGKIRYFINVAGLGLGAEVVQLMAAKEPVFGATLYYYQGIFNGFRRYKKKKVVCQGGSWHWKGKMLQMALGNGRYFGNGICIAPHASLASGTFGVAIFGNLSLWDYIRNLGKLKRGDKIVHPEVSYHSSDEIYMEGEECGIEADGEYVGQLPATFRILAGKIRLLGTALEPSVGNTY